MSSTREAVLGSIRRALRRERLDEATVQSLRERLGEPPVHEQPKLLRSNNSCFISQLEKLAGTIDSVDSPEQVPDAVMHYLQAQSLSPELVMDTHLQNLPWPTTLNIAYRSALPIDKVSVTKAFAGVAETGSIVMLSSPASPTTLNFLPDHHIVVLYQADLLTHIEDVWVRLRSQSTRLPRVVNFITGPSRTADVEQTIQLGAHGPLKLHVVLVLDTGI